MAPHTHPLSLQRYGARVCCPLARDSHAVSAGRDGDPEHIPKGPPKAMQVPRICYGVDEGGGSFWPWTLVGTDRLTPGVEPFGWRGCILPAIVRLSAVL